MNTIPLTRPYFDSEELEEVKKVLDSGWVSQGPKVKEFEKAFCEYLSTKNSICTSNCTAALHLSLLALDIGKGDEVIVPDYTFPATAHAVLYCGARPVFVDIDPKTYNIDSGEIEKKATGRTKAVIPVHTFGQSADMGPVMDIAKEREIYVIEDAACAIGAKYKGEFCGTIGDIACFSFHGRKCITSGEGGMVTTNDSILASKIRTLSMFGVASALDREKTEAFTIPEFVELGYNYKLSDIASAVGLAQLRKADEFIKKRLKLAKYYDKRLGELDFIEPPYVNGNCDHVYQSYVPLLNKGIDRNKMISLLKNVGVQAQIGTFSLCIQPVYKTSERLEKSIDVYERSLALPIYYNMDNNNIDFVVSKLMEVYSKLK